jgi:hypothetical protein
LIVACHRTIRAGLGEDDGRFLMSYKVEPAVEHGLMLYERRNEYECD